MKNDILTVILYTSTTVGNFDNAVAYTTHYIQYRFILWREHMESGSNNLIQDITPT